jgi:molybdenum cofactor cytidylyltransferase
MGCPYKANGLYSRQMVGAVLLAAGTGSRIGNRPKSLLQLGGVPLIMRQLIALSGAGVDEVVVVVGHHGAEIRQAIENLPITVVENPNPDLGQDSSVRVGLSALSPSVDAIVIALADQPMVDSQDITSLISAFKGRGDKKMVAPRRIDSEGEFQPGNPIIFDSDLKAQWLESAARVACKKWRADHPEQIKWLDTDNAHFFLDIDTEQDLLAFTQATGHTLTWPVVATS